MMGPEVKAALVTGGGRGLGRAIALKLAESGAKVGVLARTAEEVDAASAMIRDAGGESRSFVADVLDPGSLKRAFARFAEWSGGLDALVCAAGRLRGIGPLAGVDPEDWWLDLSPRWAGACVEPPLRLGLRRGAGGARPVGRVPGGGTPPRQDCRVRS
jgi:NAD(P)-dependent dehydrogenase (short-subunit alcohol dehydrogenase family)